MPRVLGIDPGTISIDFCTLEEGRDARFSSLPTAELAAEPGALRRKLDDLGRFDLIAAPSGYGLPLVRGADVDERLLRLAFLAPPGSGSGILGLRRAVAELCERGEPLVFLPGVIHLPTVAPHRKVNRIDMGTADKVCAAACAIAERAERLEIEASAVSLIVVEMGGAFTAVLAVEAGAIVDGVGGTSGPPGFRACGALDGEVAALAGRIPKDSLFTGGIAWIAGDPSLDPETWAARALAGEPLGSGSAPPGPAGGKAPLRSGTRSPERTAWLAYLEGIAKAVASQLVSAPSAREVVLGGRLARLARLEGDLTVLLRPIAPEVSVLAGTRARREARGAVDGERAAEEVFGKEAALGAALLADGLCGGIHAPLVSALRLAEAQGSVLDHLALPVAREGAVRFEALL